MLFRSRQGAVGARLKVFASQDVALGSNMLIEVKMLRYGIQVREALGKKGRYARVGILSRAAVVGVDIRNSEAGGGRPVALVEAKDVRGCAFVDVVGGSQSLG